MLPMGNTVLLAYRENLLYICCASHCLMTTKTGDRLQRDSAKVGYSQSVKFCTKSKTESETLLKVKLSPTDLDR